MQQRASATERTSLGMEVVAVAVGMGYGVVDTIARRVRRNDAHTDTDTTVILDLTRPARGAAAAATSRTRVNV
jgi:hypothetical protein